MAELRKRRESDAKPLESAESDLIDSEDDKNEAKLSADLSSTIPSGTNKAPTMLEYLLQDLPDRWRNWIVRGIFSFIMITFFLLVIYGGPLALMITTLVVQVKCFQEIINIGYAVYRIHGLPWFRSLSWYFLMTSNYFFYGENLVDYFGVLINRTDFLRGLITYHRFISFCLYCGGFVWFVLSLVKKYYMKQFSLFAWTHVALLIVVTQSYLIIKNIFEGLIWFIVPVSMIICNDIMAYVFGFFFGKTPLIKLSPKKTWEGFIGGGISTVLFGFAMSYVMCQYPYFVCPIEYSEALGRMTMECEPSALFRPTNYSLPTWLSGVLKIVGVSDTISLYPFMLHSLSLSVFSSVIGPFGGFFASGFKRAFKIKCLGIYTVIVNNACHCHCEIFGTSAGVYKMVANFIGQSWLIFNETLKAKLPFTSIIPWPSEESRLLAQVSFTGPDIGKIPRKQPAYKDLGCGRNMNVDYTYQKLLLGQRVDFGDVIPGHGGIMDRFDCQFLMATFVNVYISSFIQTDSPQKLLSQVLYLKAEQQLQLFHMLKESLEHRNILVPSV